MNIIRITDQLWQTEQINELATALVKFQGLFNEVGLSKDAKNPHLKNSYLSLDNLINTTRPLLVACGLVITQDMAGDYLTTSLIHTSGQFKGSAMNFNPMAGNKGTNLLQEIGGGITYAKRYTWAAVLGISVDTDDDGNGMKGKQVAPKKKVADNRVLVKDDQLQTVIDWAIKKSLTIADVEKHYKLTPPQKATVIKGLKKK